MAINNSSITSASIREDLDLVVEVLYSEPPGSNYVLEIAQTPGKLVAFYDTRADNVLLYVISRSGLRYLRVG